jgi:UDP-N-acetylmuramyl pentapeptide phosphotransferase/UDP-N-acetylglucosamine-1-phosphate transferase
MYFTHRIWLLKIGVPSNQKHPQSTRILIGFFSIIYLLLTFFLPEEPRNLVVLGLIITLMIFGILVEREDSGKTNRKYLAISIASVSFAVMWFVFDVYKIYCNPDSFIQPHSLWHLFSGIAAFYFYMYIRSEKNKI